MDRIPDALLECVFYLYPTAELARQGAQVGGTGFFVGVQSVAMPEKGHLYGVSCSHVVSQGEGASPIIRLNTHSGRADILEFRLDQWIRHPDEDDLAVVPIGPIDSEHLRFRFLRKPDFITKEIIDENDIGPGDDVYMIGRFSGHEGRQRNLPTVRFGNISMMPLEPVSHPRGILQESFLVETRSLGGYSGSPVFVYLPFGSHRPPKKREASGARPLDWVKAAGPYLLGIDWGHLPIFEKVMRSDRTTEVADGLVVKGNSGQMAVVPAWRLWEFLNSDELVEQRLIADVEIARIEGELAEGNLPERPPP